MSDLKWSESGPGQNIFYQNGITHNHSLSPLSNQGFSSGHHMIAWPWEFEVPSWKVLFVLVILPGVLRRGLFRSKGNFIGLPAGQYGDVKAHNKTQTLVWKPETVETYFLHKRFSKISVTSITQGCDIFSYGKFTMVSYKSGTNSQI